MSGDPSSQGSAPILALISPAALWCPVALGQWPTVPSPDGCSGGAAGESRAERTSSGNQKPSQVASEHLYIHLHYKSAWSLIIAELGKGIPSIAVQEKLQLLHFHTQVGEIPQSKENAAVFWETCSGVYRVILPC